MVKGFSKIYIVSFFGLLIVQTYLLYNRMLKTKLIFLQIFNFFANSNDVSLVIFEHQTWGSN